PGARPRPPQSRLFSRSSLLPQPDPGTPYFQSVWDSGAHTITYGLPHPKVPPDGMRINARLAGISGAFTVHYNLRWKKPGVSSPDRRSCWQPLGEARRPPQSSFLSHSSQRTSAKDAKKSHACDLLGDLCETLAAFAVKAFWKMTFPALSFRGAERRGICC